MRRRPRACRRRRAERWRPPSRIVAREVSMPDSLRSPVGHRIQRLVIALVGASLVGMAFSGLFQPDFIVRLIGFSPESTPGPYQLAEVRAVYGGLFAVVGIFTMLSAVDPAAHRG